MLSTNTTIGQEALKSRGLNFEGHFYWISIGALFGFAVLFNIGFILALSFLKCKFHFIFIVFNLPSYIIHVDSRSFYKSSAPGSSSGAIISQEKLSQLQRTKNSHDGEHEREDSKVQTPKTNILSDKG